MSAKLTLIPSEPQERSSLSFVSPPRLHRRGWEFYTNFKLPRMDKAQALRQAMLTIMKTHPNPRDWAAFTLIGESE